MDMDILELCEDEQMAYLRASFLKKGKGCRPALPADIQVMNKLFIQLYQLRFEAKTTVSEVENWFAKLCPDSSYPNNRIWPRILRIVKASKGKVGDAAQAFVDTCVDLCFISDALQAIGVTRTLDKVSFERSLITNAIALDLGNFLLKEGQSYKDFLDHLHNISSFIIRCTKEDLRTLFLSSEAKKGKLVKNVRRNPSALQTWLKEPFFRSSHQQEAKCSSSPPPSSSPSSPSSSPPPPPPPSSIVDWPSLKSLSTSLPVAISSSPSSITSWPALTPSTLKSPPSSSIPEAESPILTHQR